MPSRIDVAVVTQDPWLGGGALHQLEAFLEAVRAAGREPRVFYLSREYAVTPRRPLGWRGLQPRLAGARAYRAVVPELEPLSLAAGLRMTPSLRAARSLWVVATSAHFGLPARAARRPYRCWIGTSLDDEWAGRLAGGLSSARRLALRAGAPLLERAERAVLDGADRVYATSPASRRAVATAGRLDEESVRLLPIPVDLGRFTPEDDARWLARREEPVIAFAGRADDPRKNVPLLLEAFGLLRARLPRARLRLIGRPPRGRLPEGVSAVPDPPALEEHLRTASVLALPSHQEGFGIVVAEALACGVPVVVTPSGGPEELVRASGGGVLLDSFRAGELAAALERLLDDPDALAEHRRRGRAYVEREHSQARFRKLVAAALEEPGA